MKFIDWQKNDPTVISKAIIDYWPHHKISCEICYKKKCIVAEVLFVCVLRSVR